MNEQRRFLGAFVLADPAMAPTARDPFDSHRTPLTSWERSLRPGKTSAWLAGCLMAVGILAIAWATGLRRRHDAKSMPRSGKHDGQNCGSNDGAKENQCIETTGYVPNRPRDLARKLANPVGARMAVRKCCCHGKGTDDQKDGCTKHGKNNCRENANT